MMTSESVLPRGSIWLTKFPFSDLRTTKIRPVVVLHHDPHFDDVLVAAISSRATGHDDGVFIKEQDSFFVHTGLRQSSVIRCNRQVTLKRSRLFHQLGVLPQTCLEALDQSLLSLLNIGEPKVFQQFEQSSSPTLKPIPYAKQSINAEDVFAVVKSLRSDFLTQGPMFLNLNKQLPSTATPAMPWP